MCSHPGKKNNSVPGCTVPWIYDCVKFERMTNLYKAFQRQAELCSGGSKAAQSLQPYRQPYFTSSFRFIACTLFYPGLTHSGKDKFCASHFISPVPKRRWLQTALLGRVFWGVNGSFYCWPWGQYLLFVLWRSQSISSFLCFHLLGFTSSSWEARSCPEWDYSRNLTTNSDAVKQPRPKTKSCMFWKPVS